ncbi:MAG: HAD family hydrolase [Clostridiales bacterium]|nr:HAD family hydrolase [Clostridiales bacterium]
MKYLIFFDINGTIIQRDERTDLPFEYAMKELLSIDNPMNSIDTSARSDKDVFMEILSNFNIEFNETLWSDFLRLYEKQLILFKDSDVWRENVDAVPFIKWLSGTEHDLALITGELSIGAQYKLEKIGVWQYFQCGGFGEDGLKRFEIAEAGLKKANAMFEYERIIVIGDTLLDIQTARHIDAEIISITTGSHSKELLMTLNPDYIIDEFWEIEHKFK